jgi:hypothetical protein
LLEPVDSGKDFRLRWPSANPEAELESKQPRGNDMIDPNDIITIIGGLGWLVLLVVRQHLDARSAK